MSQPRKSVLGLSLNELGFCSSETKHDRRTASRPKLFVSARDCENKGYNPEKLSWVRVLVKIIYFPETKHNRRTVQKPKLFRRGDYKNKGNDHENLS
jgi:hypothetical protein